MIMQSIIFLITLLTIQCLHVENSNDFGPKKITIPSYSAYSIVSQSNCNETADYDALVCEWNRATSVRRYRRNLKDKTTNELTTPDSETDISSLQKRFMVDKQFENTMVTAPHTIYLLGQLMVHSSLTDFSLRSFRSDWPFKTIRNPESFRATLAQIANDGWNAFMGAHSAMNKIQLNMQQIPQHIRTARRLIKADVSYRLLSRLLPKTLRHVIRIGDECKTVSAKASNAFDQVYQLLQDVEEAATQSKKGHETERKKVHDDYNVTRIAMEIKEKERKDLDKALADTKSLVDGARHELSNALSKIPTGLNAVFYEFCYTVMDFIGDVGSAISGRGGSGGSSSTNGAGGNTASYSVKQTDSCVRQLGITTKETIGKLTNKKVITLDGLSFLKTKFDMWLKMCQKVAYNEKKEQSIQLCKRGTDTIKQVIASVEKGDDIKEEDKQEFDLLLSDVEDFQKQQSSTGNDNSASNVNVPKGRATSENPKFIVAIRQQELRNYQKTYEDRYNAFRKLNDEISDMILRMARLDLEEIHFKDILEVLRKAVKLLAQIKTNWNELIDFFKTIATEIEVSVNSILTPFVEHAEETISEQSTKGDRMYLVPMIDKLGQRVVDESHLIFLLSRTYVDISRKYLMKKLAGLSALMLMNTKEERITQLNSLNNEKIETETTIRELIDQRRRIFQEHLDKQQEKLKELEQKYADSNEDDQKMIDQDKDLLNMNI